MPFTVLAKVPSPAHIGGSRLPWDRGALQLRRAASIPGRTEPSSQCLLPGGGDLGGDFAGAVPVGPAVGMVPPHRGLRLCRVAV